MAPAEDFDRPSPAADRQWLRQAQLEQALAQLPPVLPAWKRLRPRFTLHCYERVTSTNDVLWQLPSAGSGSVVVARTQTAGRGRRGRQWQSDVGGLYLSVMVEPDWPAQAAAQLTMASVWGIVAQLQALGIAAQIKWPNDIVIRDRKLGGILIESRLEQNLIHRAVIGVGINVTNPIPSTGAAWPLASPDSAMATAAAAVLKGIWQGLYFRHTAADSVFLGAYQSVLSHLNRTVYLEGNQLKILGVSPDGRLKLASTSGGSIDKVIYLRAGEISLGYARKDTSEIADIG